MEQEIICTHDLTFDSAVGLKGPESFAYTATLLPRKQWADRDYGMCASRIKCTFPVDITDKSLVPRFPPESSR